jgi:hydrogenase-4 transcriptional activator
LLDEVGEIPLEMQGKLLRVLEQGSFEKVGDERTTRVDVRVIAATNRDLAEEVARGHFRKDLYYRLSVFQIEVPPLKERPEDVPVLAQHFLSVYSRKYRVKAPRMSRDATAQLQSYSWPGNVRELRNILERATITLTSSDPSQALDFTFLKDTNPKPTPDRKRNPSEPQLLTEQELRKLERDNLIAVLKHTKWKVSGAGGAAEFLGVNPATLAARLRALGIARSQNAEPAD